MEHTGKIVNRKENQDRTTYMLQLEHSLTVANQKIEVLTKAIHDLATDNTNQRIRIAELELR